MQVGFGEVGPLQVGSVEVGPVQGPLGEIGVAQVGSFALYAFCREPLLVLSQNASQFLI